MNNERTPGKPRPLGSESDISPKHTDLPPSTGRFFGETGSTPRFRQDHNVTSVEVHPPIALDPAPRGR